MPIPVPSRPCGYRLGSGEASVQIEVFLDLECPFSKKTWPTMLALINEADDRLNITALPIVLCDHRQSWDLTKALVAIAGDDALKGWKLIGHFYQHQAAFNHTAFDAKTREDLFSLIARLAQDFDPDLPIAELMKDIREDAGETANHAKTPNRYAIQRGVWSTPTFLINGSEVPQLESSSTIQDWQKFLAAL
jgi:protein-disulfide isomerase